MTKNWDLKLFSLVFAIILWVFATTGKKGEIGIIVPVELKGVSENLVVIDFRPHSVDVRLSGPKNLLKAVLDRGPRISVNLGAFTKGGVYKYRLTGLEMDLPRGVVIKSISPRYIEIHLDRVVKKRVKVKPVIVGSVGKYYKLVSISLSPATVELEGPSTLVKGIKELRTEDIDVTGLTETLITTKNIVGYDPSRISVFPSKIGVEVKVEPVISKKQLTVSLEPPEGRIVRVYPKRVKVVVEGPLKVLEALKSSDFKAQPSISNKPRGVAKVVVRLLKKDMENMIRIVGVEPPTVKYRLVR